MNRVLKFNSTAQRIGFTSDLHLNQKNPDIAIWNERGFPGLSEHNAGVIKTLQDFDIIFHAGDMTLNTTEEEFGAFIAQIPGTIYTLWGNHPNPMWAIYKREVAAKFGEGIEVYPFKWRNVVFMGSQVVLEVDKKTIIMNHFPMQIWDGRKHGFWHLCGHSHGSFKQTRPEHPQDYRLDIGWDIHKKPLTMGEIRAIMNGKSIGAPLDHH